MEIYSEINLMEVGWMKEDCLNRLTVVPYGRVCVRNVDILVLLS
jgi:hypothetical protein